MLSVDDASVCDEVVSVTDCVVSVVSVISVVSTELD